MYRAVSRVEGSGCRVRGWEVSPGSLCHSPVPVGCSCSSSSPSAGCSATRWCLSTRTGSRKAGQCSQGSWQEPVHRRRLTCGLAVLGVTQVAQGTFVITQVIEGDACAVHGLEVVPLVAQHLQTVLLHSLVVDQLRLQQACWKHKQTRSHIKCKTKDQRSG